jgi:hypothetical protein
MRFLRALQTAAGDGGVGLNLVQMRLHGLFSRIFLSSSSLIKLGLPNQNIVGNYLYHNSSRSYTITMNGATLAEYGALQERNPKNKLLRLKRLEETDFAGIGAQFPSIEEEEDTDIKLHG